MTRPLRVLAAVDGLWVGGTERSLVEMLPGLEDHGIEVSVACFRRRVEGVEGEVPPERLHFLSGGGFAGQVRALRSLLAELRPAVLHTALFHANLVGRFAAAGRPVAVLNSLVNTPYEPERRGDPRIRAWRLRVVQGVDAVTGRLLTDRFHAVSEAAKAAAVRSLGLPADRITVVRRGRDRRRLGAPSAERKRRCRARLDLPDEAPVLVNVGRQEYQKGHALLLRAADRLRRSHPGLRVLIAGREGSATPELERLMDELDLARTVRFLGHREDVPEILAAADAFVFPSLFEGLPGAVIEAMALGLPVVASAIAPLREVIEPGENGLLVPAGSVESLADAVGPLLEDPARREALGRRGRELYEERWTLETSVPRMAELYRSMAAGSHAGR